MRLRRGDMMGETCLHARDEAVLMAHRLDQGRTRQFVAHDVEARVAAAGPVHASSSRAIFRGVQWVPLQQLADDAWCRTHLCPVHVAYVQQLLPTLESHLDAPSTS